MNSTLKDLEPRTSEQRYQYHILSQLVKLNENIEKLLEPKTAPRKKTKE